MAASKEPNDDGAVGSVQETADELTEWFRATVDEFNRDDGDYPLIKGMDFAIVDELPSGDDVRLSAPSPQLDWLWPLKLRRERVMVICARTSPATDLVACKRSFVQECRNRSTDGHNELGKALRTQCVVDSRPMIL